MPLAYTREFLIDVALFRFRALKDYENMRPIFEKTYDERGKTDFRKYACVTPDLIKEYNAFYKEQNR